jgi:hypothetical protein
MHVRVREAGDDAAIAQFDRPRVRGRLGRDQAVPNGQLPHDGGSRVQRSDRSAGEEHRAEI